MIIPKKQLGQHFLNDRHIAEDIVKATPFATYPHYTWIEIGPGTGALTGLIMLQNLPQFYLVEIDHRLVNHLKSTYKNYVNNIIHADFLALSLAENFPGHIGIIGNFPYNISSQIFFKILENRQQVQMVTCMVQKEVAARITAKPGNRQYGLPTVLIQAFYQATYLFTVPPSAFSPPPKVQSAVIQLSKNSCQQLPCNEIVFFKMVKAAFQQRRKILKNALAAFNFISTEKIHNLLGKRAEELQVDDFIYLTQQLVGTCTNKCT